MSISGVSSTTSLLTQSLIDMRQQLDQLSQQLSTGVKSTTYSGLGTSRSLVVGLSAQLSSIGSFQSTNTILGTQLTLAQSALNQISGITSTQQQAAQQSQYSPSASGQTVDQTAAMSQLNQLIAVLNTQVGDNYIFSGRATDQPSTVSVDQILNGSGSQAGLKQIISERNQADLGADGLGRLVIPPASGTSVSVAEDAAGSPFGFKLASVTSSLTGASVTGPSGSPAAISVNMPSNPQSGDTIKFTFNLPDGTTQDLTLTATTDSPPGPDQFTIGSTPATTASNLSAALTSSVSTLASTQLTAASTVAAAHDFFDVDVNHPPQRVGGPPFTSATTLVDGTPANTVTWYTGEMSSDPARSSLSTRVDTGVTVSYGIRANEQALRSAVENIAVFAAASFSASDPNSAAAYSALTQRLSQGLSSDGSSQKVTDIAAEIANAQSTMASVKTQQTQKQTAIQNMLQGVEGISEEDVASKLLALQTNFQASLQTTAMLAKLTLTNYL
jgi:hypothetical protein